MNLKNSKFINILNGFQNVWVKDSGYKQRSVRSNKSTPTPNPIFNPRNIQSHNLTKLSFN